MLATLLTAVSLEQSITFLAERDTLDFDATPTPMLGIGLVCP